MQNRRSFLQSLASIFVGAVFASRLKLEQPKPKVLSVDTEWTDTSKRRKLFYSYPTDSAPLMGLMSICDDVEQKFLFGL